MENYYYTVAMRSSGDIVNVVRKQGVILNDYNIYQKRWIDHRTFEYDIEADSENEAIAEAKQRNKKL